MQMQYGNRKVKIEFESIDLSMHSVMGDKSRLQQVFMNLLINAMKVSPEDSKISVKASSQAIRAKEASQTPFVMLSVIVKD